MYIGKYIQTHAYSCYTGEKGWERIGRKNIAIDVYYLLYQAAAGDYSGKNGDHCRILDLSGP
jgi:hypothetical protein